ncbi:aldehyde dehydrogenase family protein, partial [bacterium]|nr:aldehyde dehydrogenase family protein [bacterium]
MGTPVQNNIESVAPAQQLVIDYSPATGEEVSRAEKTDLSRFGDIVDAARSAQQQWRELSFKQRAKHIHKMHDYIIANSEKLAEVVSRSNGKTRTDAMIAEVMTSGLSCAWYAKNTEKVLKEKNRGSGSLLMLNKRYKIVHQPLGVVGIISPWNYPL